MAYGSGWDASRDSERRSRTSSRSGSGSYDNPRSGSGSYDSSRSGSGSYDSSRSGSSSRGSSRSKGVSYPYELSSSQGASRSRAPSRENTRASGSPRSPSGSLRSPSGSRSLSGGTRNAAEERYGAWDTPAERQEPEKPKLNRAELERLYRIATGLKEPQFRDAFQEGDGKPLGRRAFFLFLVEAAIYAGCWQILLDPMMILTARLSQPLADALSSLAASAAGTLACSLAWPMFPKERRILPAAWGWMAGVVLIGFLLLQALIWREWQAQQALARFFALYVSGPVVLNGCMSFGLLYHHWRKENPPWTFPFEDEAGEERGEEENRRKNKEEQAGKRYV